MAHFMCLPDWAKGYPNSGYDVISGCDCGDVSRRG